MTAIDTVRVSRRAKDQLVKLKRVTGIQHWNVLCRWGFCLSLSEPGVPPATEIPSDSNVEMSWRVFGGRHADLYMALLKMSPPKHTLFSFRTNVRTVQLSFLATRHSSSRKLAVRNQAVRKSYLRSACGPWLSR